MRLNLRLAWRNIWRHKRRTLIVIISIAMSIGMMMMYDGLMFGFQQAIYANAVNVLGGNIQIQADDGQVKVQARQLLPLKDPQAAVQIAQKQPEVALASLRIKTGGMTSNRKGAFGVTIVGIEPEKEAQVSLISQHITSGRYLTSADQDVIFIGQGLATAMDVKTGDRVTLSGRATHEQMRSRTMTIVGIYDLKMADIEKITVYISLAAAQDLYGLPGQATEVAINLKRLGEEPAVINALKSGLTGYKISSWDQNYPEMKAALETKNGVMDIFGVIILVIAGVGILNMLLMAVYERTREIGVMGALGMKPRHISFIFLLEGGLMGLVGLFAGIVLGVGVNYIFSQVGFDYSQFSGMSEYMALISTRVYSTLGLEKIVQRGVTVLIIAILSSLIPAREAAQHEPARSLHFV